MARGGGSMLADDSAQRTAPSRCELLTNQTLSSVISKRPPPSRTKRNDTFSHTAFSGSGWRIQEKRISRLGKSAQKRRNPSGRKPANPSASLYTLAPPQRAWV